MDRVALTARGLIPAGLVFVVLPATGFRSDAGWFVILTLLSLWLYGVTVPPLLAVGGLGNQMVVSLSQLGLALLVAVPFVRAQGHPERPSENGTAAP